MVTSFLHRSSSSVKTLTENLLDSSLFSSILPSERRPIFREGAKGRRWRKRGGEIENWLKKTLSSLSEPSVNHKSVRCQITWSCLLWPSSELRLLEDDNMLNLHQLYTNFYNLATVLLARSFLEQQWCTLNTSLITLESRYSPRTEFEEINEVQSCCTFGESGVSRHSFRQHHR